MVNESYKVDKKKLDNTSKFLSLILRHKPETIGLTLDTGGWLNIQDIVSNANIDLNYEIIEHVVKTSEKKRFSISEDKKMIRANQGHSIHVNLDLKPIQPPQYLYHGTAKRFVDGIFDEGLLPQKRQYVHLSTNYETAYKVATRHGKPIILVIDAKKMYENGGIFHQSKNGVWLTKRVEKCYIQINSTESEMT